MTAHCLSWESARSGVPANYFWAVRRRSKQATACKFAVRHPEAVAAVNGAQNLLRSGAAKFPSLAGGDQPLG